MQLDGEFRIIGWYGFRKVLGFQHPYLQNEIEGQDDELEKLSYGSRTGPVVQLGVMKVLRIFIVLIGMGVLSSPTYAAAGKLQTRDRDIEKADRLGEDFQRKGPWTRPESSGDGFYGIPQPEEYLASPESKLPKEDRGAALTHYPLCYSPYTGYYEYCYPRESSYFKSRFRSPAFRSWWRSGRACPPGYYFVPEEGCYRN